MGYFYNIEGGGHYGPPYNFVVSYPIMTKFSVVMEYDKFSPKSPKNFKKITSLPSYDVIFCFRLPYPLKF